MLITGCDSGFGHRTAIHLHRLGFTVIACCLDDQSQGAKDLKKLNDNEHRLHVVKMDVTSQKEVDEALDYVQSHLPTATALWALVNNAGANLNF